VAVAGAALTWTPTTRTLSEPDLSSPGLPEFY